MNLNDWPELIARGDLCERLKITPQTLKSWQERGFPAPAREIGRLKLFRRADVAAYLSGK